ncbi:MAG: PQQ-binding-like beta-propeller repeat protein [Sphingobium sp.]
MAIRAALGLLAASCGIALMMGGDRSVAQGGPAQKGEQLYAQHCAACHGGKLEGGVGTILKGPGFVKRWTAGDDMSELFRVIKSTMPLAAPASLSDAEYHAIADYILVTNGFTPNGDRIAGTAAGAPEQQIGLSNDAPTPAGVTPRPFEPKIVVEASPASTATPTDAELSSPKPGDWLAYNRTLDGQRSSPLRQITTKNVGKLQVKCLFQLGEIGSFQNSPIAYDGKLYFNGRLKNYAIDGATCDKVWQYDYVEKGPNQAIAPARAVALYSGKVIRGTGDGHLIALDAQTGKLLWDTVVHDSTIGYAISMGVVAYGGLVYVGESGGDKGIKGRIMAFDAESGKPVWAFDVIPTGDQTGAESWHGGAETGGGPVWSTMSIDVAAGQLLVPIGNPGPDYNGRSRGGDNLFTNSVVALDLKTGQLKWWVQQVPHDTHDWDTAAAPTIYDIQGGKYMVEPSKDGWLYMYDRAKGTLLRKEPIAPEFTGIDTPFTRTHPTLFCPGAHGQWNGAAYDPAMRALFVGSEFKCTGVIEEDPNYVPGQMFYAGRSSQGPVGPVGYLQAYDGLTGKKLWSKKLDDHINAAVTVTDGGLLMTADAAGNFLAFDKKDGKELYRFSMGGAAAGGVTSYSANGKQFIAVSSGNTSRTQPSTHGAATIIVFGLPD